MPPNLPPAVAQMLGAASPEVKEYLLHMIEDRGVEWVEVHIGLLKQQAELIDGYQGATIFILRSRTDWFARFRPRADCRS